MIHSVWNAYPLKNFDIFHEDLYWFFIKSAYDEARINRKMHVRPTKQIEELNQS